MTTEKKEAPERVWIDGAGDAWPTQPKHPDEEIEYVRADLYDQAVKAFGSLSAIVNRDGGHAQTGDVEKDSVQANAAAVALLLERDELRRQLKTLAQQCGPSCAEEIDKLRAARDELLALAKRLAAVADNAADISDLLDTCRKLKVL